MIFLATHRFIMSSSSEVLFLYKNFYHGLYLVLHSYSCFRADYIGEYISCSLRAYFVEQGTLAQLSCPDAHAKNGVAEFKHDHLLEMNRAFMIVVLSGLTVLARIVSTSMYLINIKHFLALQGGIPLERLLWGCSPDHRMLFVYLVRYATSSCPLSPSSPCPHEHTKPTT
jgi:hypothetical protein